jgi:hypothetical protein
MTELNQKQIDRQDVLDAVYQSINVRMTNDSVGEYVRLARQYGESHGIAVLVDDWIMDGRTTFSSQTEARQWADSLPKKMNILCLVIEK